MKKQLFASLAGVLCLAVVGCGGLKDKSVAIDANGIGLKASTAVDSSTGTPLPTVSLGEFGGAFVDHNKDDGDLVYYREEKSLWGSEVSQRTFIMMKKGAAETLTVKPDQVVNLPGLSVVSGSSTIKITALSESTQPDSGATTQVGK